MDDIAQDENRRGLRVESIPRTKQKTGEMKRTEKGGSLSNWRKSREEFCLKTKEECVVLKQHKTLQREGR